MNILVIPSWYPTEDKPGNGIFFKEQVEALLGRGHNVTVAYADLRFKLNGLKTGLFKAENTQVNTYIYRRRSLTPNLECGRWPQRIFMLEKLYKLIVKLHGKPDIIHLHSCRMAVEAAHLCKKHCIPMIYTEHFSGILENKSSILFHQLKIALKNSSYSIAVSEQLKKAMSPYGENISYIPNMVDTKIFKPQTMPKNTQNKSFVFGAMGNLVPIKCFDILIMAFAIVAGQIPFSTLLIAGSGQEKQNLQFLINKLNLCDKVQLIGYVNREDTVVFFNNCDCFVCSSKIETFGAVIIEALACGKPVAATLCGGPQSIINQTNGILCEIENPQSLADAMLFIAKQIELFDSHKIREDCVNRFDKEVICAKLEGVYSSVLHQI
jgi:glycosyltransferase involved in cell wall biosynthesis